MCKVIQNFPYSIKEIVFSLIFLLFSATSVAQTEAQYLQYINDFKEIAMEQMRQYHIPASITLAQGILESGCGTGRLAVEGNNHFGIKCANWNGPTMSHDDDEEQECFRVYETAAESYRDHSLFLQKPRYQSLFALDAGDYKGWAEGLSRCGYATDPAYPSKLIDIIERFGLHSLDEGTSTVSDIEIAEEIAEGHIVRRKDGKYYVSAREGDTFAAIAEEFGVKLHDLLEWNGKQGKDAIPACGEPVYLQPKE